MATKKTTATKAAAKATSAKKTAPAKKAEAVKKTATKKVSGSHFISSNPQTLLMETKYVIRAKIIDNLVVSLIVFTFDLMFLILCSIYSLSRCLYYLKQYLLFLCCNYSYYAALR